MKGFIDSREPDEVKLKAARGNADGPIHFETKELSQGDFYLPEYDVVVERKEASDFASSITDGRLSDQADRMVAEHSHVFLVIENDIECKGFESVAQRKKKDTYNSLYNLAYSDIDSNSITGMQTSLAVKRGVKIIYTEGLEDTLYAVERIFERFVDEEHQETESGYVKTSDTGEVEDVQVAMLMQVDGISEEKAREILSAEIYGSIKNMCGWIDANQNSVFNRLQEVDGVGEVLANRVIEAFQ